MAIGSGVLLPGVAENPTFPILRALAYTTGLGYRPTCDLEFVFLAWQPGYETLCNWLLRYVVCLVFIVLWSRFAGMILGAISE